MRKAMALFGILAAVVVLGWAGSDGVRGGSTAEAASETTTIRWGPYTVPAAQDGMPGALENLIAFGVEKPCTDCYVTGIVPNMVYADGTTANFSTGGMMHHVVVLNGSGTDSTCAGTFIGSLGERLFASGNERTVMAAPEGYGYYIAPGDSWNLIMHLMNMQSSPQDMYLEFEFTYRPGADAVEPVTPVWLDVDNCADSEYFVSAGHTDTHWDWPSDREGYIVGIGGHLHDYGISISAENVDLGRYMCTSVAGFADGSSRAPAPVTPLDEGHVGAANVMDPGDASYMGHIEDMTSCTPMFPVYLGDTIRLHSQYNAPADDGTVMGIMVVYMHETPIPPDADFDGWMDDAELIIGTDPYSACGVDAWPPDFNSDGTVTGADLSVIARDIGESVPPAPARSDIAPDPPDGQMTGADMSAVATNVGENCY